MSGAGTEDDPYMVEDADDLKTLATNTNSGSVASGTYYKLANDIDLNGSETNQWTPIGKSNPDDMEDDSKVFLGIFDGDGHTISGLFINSDYNDTYVAVGLFGTVGLNGVVTDNGTVKNLTVAGTLTGSENVGGIVGLNRGQILNCCSNVNVSSAANPNTENDLHFGGIAGISYGPVMRCYSTGSVSVSSAPKARLNVGGVVGLNSFIIENCYSIGSVSASDSDSEKGSSNVGGVAGWNMNITRNCYSYGNVSATGSNLSVGGVVGLNDSNDGTITACYYLKDTASYGVGGTTTDTSGQTTVLTADEFKDQSIFTGAGWDFSGTWYMENPPVRPLLGVGDSSASYTNKYTITIPEALSITRSGWNPTDGITVSADTAGCFDPNKKIVVDASSASGFFLVPDRGTDTIAYTVLSQEGDTEQTIHWEFTGAEVNAKTNKPVGIYVNPYATMRPAVYKCDLVFKIDSADIE